jgi:hypothetical protein
MFKASFLLLNDELKQKVKIYNPSQFKVEQNNLQNCRDKANKLAKLEKESLQNGFSLNEGLG